MKPMDTRLEAARFGLLTRGALRCVALIAALTVVGVAIVPPSPASALLSGCAAGSGCVTSQNVSGYVTPSPQAYTFEDDSNLAGDVYSNGTNVDDRVNSIRNRNTSPYWKRLCFYRDAGYVVLRSSVADTHPGWFDNSSTDISSLRGVASTC